MLSAWLDDEKKQSIVENVGRLRAPIEEQKCKPKSEEPYEATLPYSDATLKKTNQMKHPTSTGNAKNRRAEATASYEHRLICAFACVSRACYFKWRTFESFCNVLPLSHQKLNKTFGNPLFYSYNNSRADIAHFDHGLREGSEESGLVSSKSIDDVYGVGARTGKQLLVTLKQPIARLEVGVIVVVEFIGCGEVQVSEISPGSILGTQPSQSGEKLPWASSSQNDGDLSRNGEDVGARDGGGTSIFEGSLDVVHDI
ncbi:Peroxidase 54 [Senna tora]|uniref:Peroxidase 54 n=1 Tax=Senna tora TaxID=362788 RepID=A0A834X5E9_9FABA|nr:Peroxidase 54 [Senna tora]